MKNIVKVICRLLWLVILGYVVYKCHTDKEVHVGLPRVFRLGLFW